jgi:hypothetical protein
MASSALFVACLARCEQQSHEKICDDTPGAAPVVDTEVMAFLSKARALHHEANVKENGNDLAGAIASLETLVGSPVPRPGTTIPEVEEVLADTYARIADLKLEQGDVDGAAKDVDAGLAHSPGTSYFHGHLLEVQGIVEEQRATRLADGGKSDEAAKARAHAVQLLRQAVDMQDQVIKNATARDGALSPINGAKP